MTAPGSRKHDAKGRSTGQIKTHQRQKIEGSFVAHRLDMLRSPARMALSLSARKVLERLEIEHMENAGLKNGNLCCTFDDFERHGIHRHSIAPAIRELEALGFIEVKRGRAGNGEHRAPSYYTLTYLNTSTWRPTDDWRRIETAEQAQTIAAAARK